MDKPRLLDQVRGALRVRHWRSVGGAHEKAVSDENQAAARRLSCRNSGEMSVPFCQTKCMQFRID